MAELERLTRDSLSRPGEDRILSFCSVLRSRDSQPCSFWGYSVADVADLKANPNKIALSLSVDDSVVGLAVLSRGGRFQEHWAEISVAVHPDYRKRGLAEQLVLELEEHAKEMGLEFIKALILENNEGSRRFFRSLGYEHKATLFHDFKLERLGNVSDCAYYKALR